MKLSSGISAHELATIGTRFICGIGLWFQLFSLFTVDAQAQQAVFGSFTAIPASAPGECVAIGDLNHDGRSDVVLGTERFGNGTNRQSILVFLQTADGELSAPVKYSVGVQVSSMAIADLTGDGRNDIAVAKDRSGIRVFAQGTNGDFSNFSDYQTSKSFRLCAGDFNNDHQTDLAAVGYTLGSLELFVQDGGILRSAGLLSPNFSGWNELEAGDVNSDGLIDIIGISDIGYPRVYLQTPTGFASGFTYALDGSALGIGDLSGDGRSDIAMSVYGNRPNSKLSVLIQQSDGTMAVGPVLDSYDTPSAVVVSDMNQDGRMDVVVLHAAWRRVGVYFQLDSGTLDSELLFETSLSPSRNPHGLAVGDINGDGMPDIVIADSDGLIVLTNRLPRPIRHLTHVSFGSGRSRFRLNGISGNSYCIEASSNLVTWLPWMTNTIPAEGYLWVEDSDTPLLPRRYYRATAQAGSGTSNDLFANRRPVPGVGGTVTGSNAGATTEPGESSHGGVPGGKSAWWTWTAPSSGPTAIFTDGSSFDTTLAVYTGSTLTGLTFVAEDDDSGSGAQSRVVFNAIVGTTYQIAVDGYSGTSGDIVLSVKRGVGNDTFAGRWTMTGLSDLVVGYNVGANWESGEPFHWETTGGASVWWRWQAPVSGTVTISTYGSSFDTLLAAYLGNQVSNLPLVANNDDYGGAATSRISFFAVAGTFYHIAVDGYSGASGTIWLELLQSQ